MREKEFLDYFPELKGRPKEEQIALLGAARYEAFSRQKLVGKAVLLMILVFLIVMLIASVPLILGSESILLNTLALGAGLAIALPIYKRLYGRLLRQGLNQVLGRESHNQ